MPSVKTSLSKQLASITESSFASAQRGVSFMFNPKTATHYSNRQIFDSALYCYSRLCSMDKRFFDFDSIFSDQLLEVDVETLTPEQLKITLSKVSEFLPLLSDYFMHQESHSIIEWLIRQFNVHSLCFTDLITSFLPYHEEELFIRLVKCCELNNTDFYFLEGIKVNEKVMNFEDMSNCIRDNPGILMKVIEKINSNKIRYVSTTLINFFVKTSLTVLSNQKLIRNNDLIQLILTGFVYLIKNNVTNNKINGLLVLFNVLLRLNLKNDVISNLFNLVHKHCSKIDYLIDFLIISIGNLKKYKFLVIADLNPETAMKLVGYQSKYEAFDKVNYVMVNSLLVSKQYEAAIEFIDAFYTAKKNIPKPVAKIIGKNFNRFDFMTLKRFSFSNGLVFDACLNQALKADIEVSPEFVVDGLSIRSVLNGEDSELKATLVGKLLEADIEDAQHNIIELMVNAQPASVYATLFDEDALPSLFKHLEAMEDPIYPLIQCFRYSNGQMPTAVVFEKFPLSNLHVLQLVDYAATHPGTFVDFAVSMSMLDHQFLKCVDEYSVDFGDFTGKEKAGKMLSFMATVLGTALFQLMLKDPDAFHSFFVEMITLLVNNEDQHPFAFAAFLTAFCFEKPEEETGDMLCLQFEDVQIPGIVELITYKTLKSSSIPLNDIEEIMSFMLAEESFPIESYTLKKDIFCAKMRFLQFLLDQVCYEDYKFAIPVIIQLSTYCPFPRLLLGLLSPLVAKPVTPLALIKCFDIIDSSVISSIILSTVVNVMSEADMNTSVVAVMLSLITQNKKFYKPLLELFSTNTESLIVSKYDLQLTPEFSTNMYSQLLEGIKVGSDLNSAITGLDESDVIPFIYFSLSACVDLCRDEEYVPVTVVSQLLKGCAFALDYYKLPHSAVDSELSIEFFGLFMRVSEHSVIVEQLAKIIDQKNTSSVYVNAAIKAMLLVSPHHVAAFAEKLSVHSLEAVMKAYIFEYWTHPISRDVALSVLKKQDFSDMIKAKMHSLMKQPNDHTNVRYISFFISVGEADDVLDICKTLVTKGDELFIGQADKSIALCELFVVTIKKLELFAVDIMLINSLVNLAIQVFNLPVANAALSCVVTMCGRLSEGDVDSKTRKSLLRVLTRLSASASIIERTRAFERFLEITKVILPLLFSDNKENEAEVLSKLFRIRHLIPHAQFVKFINFIVDLVEEEDRCEYMFKLLLTIDDIAVYATIFEQYIFFSDDVINVELLGMFINFLCFTCATYDQFIVEMQEWSSLLSAEKIKKGLLELVSIISKYVLNHTPTDISFIESLIDLYQLHTLKDVRNEELFTVLNELTELIEDVFEYGEVLIITSFVFEQDERDDVMIKRVLGLLLRTIDENLATFHNNTSLLSEESSELVVSIFKSVSELLFDSEDDMFALSLNTSTLLLNTIAGIGEMDTLQVVLQKLGKDYDFEASYVRCHQMLNFINGLLYHVQKNSLISIGKLVNLSMTMISDILDKHFSDDETEEENEDDVSNAFTVIRECVRLLGRISVIFPTMLRSKADVIVVLCAHPIIQAELTKMANSLQERIIETIPDDEIYEFYDKCMSSVDLVEIEYFVSMIRVLKVVISQVANSDALLEPFLDMLFEFLTFRSSLSILEHGDFVLVEEAVAESLLQCILQRGEIFFVGIVERLDFLVNVDSTADDETIALKIRQEQMNINIDRLIPLFVCLTVFSDKLQFIFSPFFPRFVDYMVGVFTFANKYDDLTMKESHCFECVINYALSAYHYLEDINITLFNDICKPTVQLMNAVHISNEPELANDVVKPLLFDLMLAASNDILYKELSRNMFLFAQLKSDLVKELVLNIQLALYEKLGSEFSCTHSECIPFIAELAEETNSTLRKLVRNLMRKAREYQYIDF
ncbi:hypothetical protein PCE1_000775 [Barthelona sp. PCE]